MTATDQHPPTENAIAIVCNTCHMRSPNEDDIQRRYCGHCHQFHQSPTDYVLEYGPPAPPECVHTPEEKAAAWADYVAKQPEGARATMRRCPAYTCYRMHGDRGHYWIESYQFADGRTTLTLAHGRDSYMPGVGVFGIRPQAVRQCGCGKWEMPTREQRADTRARIDRERLTSTHKCNDPRCSCNGMAR